MNLKLSAWAAVISAVLVIPSFITGILLAISPESETIYIVSVAMIFITVLVSLPVYLGYIRVAKINKIKLLETMMYISLSFVVLFNLYTIIAVNSFVFLGIIFIITVGIIDIITGVAILKLKNVFGGLTTAIGVMYIITGIFTASVILVFFAPILAIAIGILEAIFFFKASKMYDK